MVDNIIKEICKKIYDTMGKGYTECLYQNCICLELQKNNIIYQKEVNLTFKYENMPVGWGRLDIVFTYKDVKYIIELKHVLRLTSKDRRQVERYLQHTTDINYGFLVNFGGNDYEIFKFNKEKNNINYKKL